MMSSHLIRTAVQNRGASFLRARGFSKLAYGSQGDGTQQVYDDPNFPKTGDGRVLHLNAKAGDIANRIVTVGDPERAKRLLQYLDKPDEATCLETGRGFVIYNGTVRAKPVSIVSIGMGMAMMDFLVREARQVVSGKMAIIRFGSCGGLREEHDAGTVVIASKGSVSIVRNPNAFGPSANANDPAYYISKPVLADDKLSSLLVKNFALIDSSDGINVQEGMNVTGDSFYGSQGRIDSNFDDKNEDVLDNVCSTYPDALTCEMETFQLLHLAQSSKGTISASAAKIILANRVTAGVLDSQTMAKVESLGGQAVLHAISEADI